MKKKQTKPDKVKEEKPKEKVVLIYSGGLDSTVLLVQLMQDYDVYPLSVDYGQRHRAELHSAAYFASTLKLPFRIARCENLKKILKGSSQTDNDVKVPHGHYTDKSMKTTVVPNRNMILFSLAIGYAVSIGAGRVFYAAHTGDHAIYPDCRPEFVEAMARVAKLCSYEPIQIQSTFQEMSKADIVKLGAELEVDMANTWSCYEGDAMHCGECGTCTERIEAFKKAGVDDLTPYKVKP